MRGSNTSGFWLDLRYVRTVFKIGSTFWHLSSLDNVREVLGGGKKLLKNINSFKKERLKSGIKF